MITDEKRGRGVMGVRANNPLLDGCGRGRLARPGRDAEAGQRHVPYEPREMPDVVGARPSPGCPAVSVRGGRATGRGRAKAKQTKVARELKYHSPNTDLAALQRELTNKTRSDDDVEELVEYADDEFDDYDDADDEDEDSDDGNWAARQR